MDSRILAPNLAELYLKAADRYDSLPAFATRREGIRWEPISFRELRDRGLELATGLIELGVRQREHVALFSDNREEWIVSDYAIQFCGAVTVPKGSDVTDEEILYILSHADIRFLFVESRTMLERVMGFRQQLPGLQEIILMDRPAMKMQGGNGYRLLTEVQAMGGRLREEGDRRAEERVAGIDPEDLFTLIYTSGTTGTPKGVMLTHANIMSQLEVIPIRLLCTDRVLSLLPVWHIFERLFEVYTISCGTCTYYTSVRTLAEDLQLVEPTFMGSAPRLWESLYQRILLRVEHSHPIRRTLFRMGLLMGRWYRESLWHLRGDHLQLQPEPLWKRWGGRLLHLVRWAVVLPWYGFFNVAVLETIRQGAGGSLKATISGGGALPAEIDRFFNYIGIPVLEGYGMTETSPVLAVRTPDHLVVETVGPPVGRTDVRIVNPETGELLWPVKGPDPGWGRKGEIQVRGPQVMKGYYKDPQLTEQTIGDGWMRTGDLGMMTANGCLKIVGRWKSTIVLSSGENLEPEPIEMRLNQSFLIDNCMVVGQDQKQISALIVPDLEEFRRRGFVAETLAALVAQPAVEQMIREEIRTIISPGNGFKKHELIRDFRLLEKPFEPGDELTTLFKLRRHVIREKYAEVIRELYSREPVVTAG